MGKLKNKSGSLITRAYNQDIESRVIKLIEDSRCVSVIGAYPSITSKNVLNSLAKKKIGFVLFSEGYSYEVMKSCHPDSQYTPINKNDIQGMSKDLTNWLDKTDNLWGDPFRWIRPEHIEDGEGKYKNQMLHSKMLGVVDEKGQVYTWVTGSWNPTVSGNNNLDNIAFITDPTTIEEYNEIYVGYLVESVKLDIIKSSDLSKFLEESDKNDNRDVFLSAWKKASVSESKYIKDEPRRTFDKIMTDQIMTDQTMTANSPKLPSNLIEFDFDFDFDFEFDFNEEYLPLSPIMKSPTHYFRAVDNRQYILKMSKETGIPTGASDDNRFAHAPSQAFYNHDILCLPHKPEGKETRYLTFRTHQRSGKYLHKVLYFHFFTWFEKTKGIWRQPNAQKTIANYKLYLLNMAQNQFNLSKNEINDVLNSLNISCITDMPVSEIGQVMHELRSVSASFRGLKPI